MTPSKLAAIALLAAFLPPAGPSRAAGAEPAAGNRLPNPFFAMDTGTRDEQHATFEDQAALLADLGYDGMDHSGTAGIPEKLKALDERRLKLFGVYTGATIDGEPRFDPGLKAAVEALKGREAVIWLYVLAKKLLPSAPEGDPQAVEVLREVADLAAASGLRVALYPHTGFWVEKVDDAVRVAAKVARKNLGVTFNLCHSLMVDGEGGLRDRLERALPHLFVVTVNGADRSGRDWKALIQTLDRGSFDIAQVLSALKALGYRGPVGLQGYGIGGDARENLRRSMEAWRRLSGKVAAEPDAPAGSPGESGLADPLDRAVASLALYGPEDARPVDADWLVAPIARRAGAFRTGKPGEVVLANGLVSRTFRVRPNGATVGYRNLATGESVIRGVKPEAVLVIDGKRVPVGGLLGQPDYGYLLEEWIDSMRADPAALRCVGIEAGATKERFPWKRARHAEDRPWPPPGASLAFRYEAPAEGGGAAPRGLAVTVRYELYDGMPALAKWIEVENGTGRPVRLDGLVTEVLAAVDYESSVENPHAWESPNIHIDSDYAFLGMDPKSASKTMRWGPDPEYLSQVNYRRESPVLLECRPPIGPGLELEPGGRLESFRTFELPFDSTDRERKGLSVRRMYRALAPWATENPILMHVRSADPAAVRRAVDQCADAGFEMVIMTFGSGFDLENTDPAYMAGIRALVEHAHAKGIELGGYGLLASRSVSPADDVIDPKTGKPGNAVFGNSPCLGSRWGIEYFRKLRAFVEATGIDVIEHDGSYPGDVCASTSHPGHRGLEDSQWTQWRAIADFYRWCRGRGVYLNVPDWYILNGSSKTGMGYREDNWSLPRDRQVVLGRQNIYDGTWMKEPSMGWMFVPLVEYQGGGAAATLEPLREHLADYERHLAQNFTSGVQACYRGPRLYDGEETRAVVKRWVDIYKRHRAIFDSSIVHIRRPDGRDLDAILHVNPRISEKGLAVVHNPLGRPLRGTVVLPLYHTGIADRARVREGEGEARTYDLDRQYRIRLDVEVPARGLRWFVIEDGR